MNRPSGNGLLRSLSPADVIIIGFLAVLSVVACDCPGGIAALLLPINALSCAAVVLLAVRTERSDSSTLRIIHDWYPAPAVFLIFKEVYIIIQAIAGPDWDGILIAADRWMFGVDPTVWCARFAAPVITEILQLSYASYYFLMIAVAYELYARSETRKFSFTMFVILYGFFLSYIGYLLFPAVGPRFTLHDFGSINTDLPGVWLTDSIRAFLNAGESIPSGVSNAIRHAQRDAFPSGHTQMTLLSCYLAHRYRLAVRWFVTAAGTLLIISTVYLRYHYVVDVLGGIAFFALTLFTAPALYRLCSRRSVKLPIAETARETGSNG